MTDTAAHRKTATAAAKAPAPKGVAAVRDGATKALDRASDTAADLARKTAAGIEANPISVLAGGLALGALAGAFVPRSNQEAKLLAPVGQRLADTAKGAVEAAKGTALSEFDVLGLTRNAAKDQVGKILGDVLKTLATAGTAALTTAKTSAAGGAKSKAPEKADAAE